MPPLQATLARISADEMVRALGAGASGRFVRTPLFAFFSLASVRLGRVLARFDERVADCGLAQASAAALSDFGVTWDRNEGIAASGPALIVANHPGAYDALALLAALGRTDVAIVAADRTFLRALPSFARHLAFLPDDPATRAFGLRRAMRHLQGGGALLHFGAGEIEPDPAFYLRGAGEELAPWLPGTGALVRATARAGGVVVAALVSGVHSARVKRLLVTRFAERRGVTTLAPLLQIALPVFRDVHVRVRFAEAVDARVLAGDVDDDATITARARARALALLV